MTSHKYVHYLLISLIGLCLTGTSNRTWAQQMPRSIDVFSGLGNSSNPSGLTAIGNRLIFNATNSGIGKEPHISDGTVAGTKLLKDIFTGTNSSNAQYFTEFVVGGITYAYYFANDNSNSGALYRTNINDGTTELVVNVNPLGSASSIPGVGRGRFLINVGGTLFFAGQDPTGRQELFKSDGTAGGTTLVKDINSNPIGGFTMPSNPRDLTNIDGKLFFTADANFNGGLGNVNRELWVSDGTAAGTRLVKDIHVGTNNSSNPSNLVEKNGLCYFFANDGLGEALWRSDGTAAGTFKVSLPSGTNVDVNAGIVNCNNILFFAATSSSMGTELWISDGVNAVPLDLNTGTSSSNPAHFTSVDGICYFSATNATSGAELWKSNGTVGGTRMVKDIFAGAFGSSPQNLTKVQVNGPGSVIYWSQLWVKTLHFQCNTLVMRKNRVSSANLSNLPALRHGLAKEDFQSERKTPVLSVQGGLVYCFYGRFRP